MDEHENESLSNLEWQNRVLCSDESCIGTIGKDGRCTECGKPYAGELPTRTVDEPAQAPAAPAEPAPTIDSPPPPDTGEPVEESNPDWEKRQLCPDENCIGVIGPDGRCKECGRPLT